LEDLPLTRRFDQGGVEDELSQTPPLISRQPVDPIEQLAPLPSAETV
jgi:hypothetical protein